MMKRHLSVFKGSWVFWSKRKLTHLKLGKERTVDVLLKDASTEIIIKKRLECSLT